ncbi:PilZ domain-containing protein [Desulfonatronum thioautotrophicum]|uniref:PilZ domain-containing protein n=1 Tax=Desulfonatronum thioautotrophicum TaxID=617001 RepID=UPI0005EAD725|nr:PilZ domain-containing protein [Desulfonatronum thioautotrophicum]
MISNFDNNTSLNYVKDITEAIIDQPNESYRAVLRKSFRVPQDDAFPLRVTVNGLEAELVDSSENGIKLLYKEDMQWDVDQTLERIELAFMEQRVHASGVVVHSFSTDSGAATYGVRLNFPDVEGHNAFKEYHAVIRKRLFQGQHATTA